MDPLNVFAEKEGKTSPSHTKEHLTKLDRESLDDFEHISKETSPLKDETSQFINMEKGRSDDLLKEFDEKASFDPFSKPIAQHAAGGDPFASLIGSELKGPGDDSFGASKNFMQYEKAQDSGKDQLNDFIMGETQPSVKLPTKELDSDESQPEDDDSIVSSNVKAGEKVKDSPTPEPIISITPEPTKPSTPSPEPPKKLSPEPAPFIEPPQPQHDPTPILPPKAATPNVIDNEEAVPPPLPRDYPEIGVLEPRELLTACGLYTWFHPERLNPKVEALVYWRDPKRSGVVFGSVFVVLLSLTLFSLISVVAYTSLTILTAAISFRVYKNILQAVQKTSEGHPFNTYLLPVLEHPVVSAVFQIIEEYLEIDLTLSPERVRDATDVAVTHVNSALTELRRRFLVEDLVDSLKFGLFLYVLTYLGAWFNGLTLIIIGFVALFTLPKVYENNQTQIDANLAVVCAKIDEFKDKIKAVIPIGKKSEGDSKDKAE